MESMSFPSDIINEISRFVPFDPNLRSISTSWNDAIIIRNRQILDDLIFRYPYPHISISLQQAAIAGDFDMVNQVANEYKGYLPITWKDLIPIGISTARIIYDRVKAQNVESICNIPSEGITSQYRSLMEISFGLASFGYRYRIMHLVEEMVYNDNISMLNHLRAIDYSNEFGDALSSSIASIRSKPMMEYIYTYGDDDARSILAPYLDGNIPTKDIDINLIRILDIPSSGVDISSFISTSEYGYPTRSIKQNVFYNISKYITSREANIDPSTGYQALLMSDRDNILSISMMRGFIEPLDMYLTKANYVDTLIQALDNESIDPSVYQLIEYNQIDPGWMRYYGTGGLSGVKPSLSMTDEILLTAATKGSSKVYTYLLLMHKNDITDKIYDALIELNPDRKNLVDRILDK